MQYNTYDDSHLQLLREELNKLGELEPGSPLDLQRKGLNSCLPALRRMECALKIVALNPKINAWLAKNDPHALMIVRHAIGVVG